jgi:hypothetical protein
MSQGQATKRDAFVYAIKVDGIVRYIGKGTNRRIKEHIWVVQKILRGQEPDYAKLVHYKLAEAKRSGATITSEIVAKEMTSAEAYEHEKRLVAEDRANAPGQLWNVASGGAGFPSDLAPELLAEITAKVSKKAKLRWSNPEWRTARLAQINDPSALAAQSEAMKQRWTEAGYRARQSVALAKAIMTQTIARENQ